MNVIIACIGCYVLGICSLIIYEEARDWYRASRQIRQEQTTYTSGAAYDACEEPVTDYDAEAVRKLLSW